MTPYKRFLICIPLLAGVVILLGAGQGLCQTAEEIFRWTARQMKIEQRLEMPSIRYVDIDELKQVFIENNQNAYLSWESEYGKEGARKILKLYLDEIIGLYDVDSGVIYVGSFLSPCRRKAILAHEMTHYFQTRSGVPSRPDGRTPKRCTLSVRWRLTRSRSASPKPSAATPAFRLPVFKAVRSLPDGASSRPYPAPIPCFGSALSAPFYRRDERPKIAPNTPRTI